MRKNRRVSIGHPSCFMEVQLLFYSSYDMSFAWWTLQSFQFESSFSKCLFHYSFAAVCKKNRTVVYPTENLFEYLCIPKLRLCGRREGVVVDNRFVIGKFVAGKIITTHLRNVTLAFGKEKSLGNLNFTLPYSAVYLVPPLLNGLQLKWAINGLVVYMFWKI